MIYGLLWLALGAYVVTMRRQEPGAPFKYNLALAGVGVCAAAWFAHLSGLDLGLATEVLNWAAAGVLLVLILWIVIREMRSFHAAQPLEHHSLSSALFVVVVIAAFAFAPMFPGYGAVVIMTAGAIYFLLSLLIGPRRRA
jgi:hypothetical protein